MSHLQFGKEYILPKPMDPRLLLEVAPAVARGAAESGVATRPIDDMEAYKHELERLMNADKKLIRSMVDTAKRQPKRVIFSEGNTDNMLRAAVDALQEGICYPILLGNDEMIEKRAKRLGLELDGITIINPRHDNEAERREKFATRLATKHRRNGATLPEALEKMFDRNYFGMMMVECGEADAMIAGTYSASPVAQEIAKETIGIRPDYDHFIDMHIVTTKRGTYFLADTGVNRTTDEDTLFDVARLARYGAGYFAVDPVVAMISYSDFGSSPEPESRKVHNVVEKMHKLYPEVDIDGEMQIDYALNTAHRDKMFPFSKIAGKDVNTLVFPNLSAASTAFKMMLEMGVGEAIGPIQVGLNKPIHFIKVDSPVRDIVNLATVCSIDAAVSQKVNTI